MIPVILSGGEGKRLWPLSTSELPKQFCPIFDEPLQAKTIRRLLPLVKPWIVTTQSLRSPTVKTNETFNIPNENVLYEPMGRNTAPAIALICHAFAQKHMHNEIIGIFPADHLITKNETFISACLFAEKWAAKGKIVTFGIKPSFASTGYGYIEIDPDADDKQDKNSIHFAKRFHEKPKAEKANEFIKSGRHFWNSGMFVFRVSTMISQLEKHIPQTWQALGELKSDLSNLETIYAKLDPKSIDYAVMEKSEDIFCIPLDMGWSDVGSWDEIARIKESKSKSPHIYSEDTSNYIHPIPGKKYAILGAQDLIVIDTEHGLLICKKGESEKLKLATDSFNKV